MPGDLLAATAALTMSSVEIAELTGREHRNVMRDIRAMLADLGGMLGFEHTHRNPQNGQDYPIFRLPKRECIILVSGYSVEMRARIVDRWLELEGQAARKVPDLSDPAVLVSLLLEHTTKRVEAERKVEEMQPKVEAHDRIADAAGTYCRQTAAKMLGISPQKLIAWMRTNGWTFRRAGSSIDLARQARLDAGDLKHIIATGLRADGTQWSATRIHVTAKGMLALAKAFPAQASLLDAEKTTAKLGLGNRFAVARKHHH